MSGIFVDDKDVFLITVHYAEKDGAIEILDSAQKDSKSLTVTFRIPDFATSQAILNRSVDAGANGAVNLNMMNLKANILYLLVKSWDARDFKGEPLPLGDNINKLRVEIAKVLMDRLIERFGTNII